MQKRLDCLKIFFDFLDVSRKYTHKRRIFTQFFNSDVRRRNNDTISVYNSGNNIDFLY